MNALCFRQNMLNAIRQDKKISIIMKTISRFFIVVLMILLSHSVFAQQSRIQYSLNSAWYFHKGDVKQHPLNSNELNHLNQINIPHTWNAADVLDDEPGYYRGIAWYYKKLNISDDLNNKQIYLYFEGINQDAEIYINGDEIGKHLGGYTAFSFNITSYLKRKQTNLLSVKVSNAVNDRLPPLAGDLCHFGGIYRDVWLIAVNPLHMDMDTYASSGIFIETPFVDSSQAQVKIRGKIFNHGSKTKKVKIVHHILSPENEVLKQISQTKKVRSGQEHNFSNLKTWIKNPKLWSPEDPNLYTVHTQIKDVATGEVLDEVKNPLGFRWFEADAEKGFFLNGQHYFLKGMGKHQDFKGMGYAVTNEILVQDILLMKEAGINLVRAHYPQDPSVTSAYNRMGMFRVGRIPIMDKISFSDAYKKNTKHMLTEMIMQGYNDPSVIIWEYMNEVFGDMDWYWEKPRDPAKVEKQKAETYKLSKELEDHVKSLDANRLTEMVFHTSENPQWYREAGLSDLCDINGWNIYMGWYHVNLDNTGNALDHFRAYNPKKSYLLTEFGAGSDSRIHTYEPTIFDNSIEYQTQFHKVYLDEVAKRPYIMGMLPWTFVDFQVESRHDAVPHVNSKGLLTTDRQKKDAFYLYKAHWSHEPFVYIAGKDWNQRIELSTKDAPVIRDIQVFTNLPQVELFLNNQSLGIKNTEFCETVWQVPFESNVNFLLAKGKQARKALMDYAEIEIIDIKSLAQIDRLPAKKICINVGQSRTVFLDKAAQNYWMSDRKYSQRFYGHLSGEYYRTWNGMPAWQGIREGVNTDILKTDIDPIFQTFLVGVQDYQLDVPAGDYIVQLYFAEPFLKERRLKPEEKTGADTNGDRIFDVLINNTLLTDDLNLAEEFGGLNAVIKSYKMSTQNEGLRISLRPEKGKPILSGILVQRQ